MTTTFVTLSALIALMAALVTALVWVTETKKKPRIHREIDPASPNGDCSFEAYYERSHDGTVKIFSVNA